MFLFGGTTCDWALVEYLECFKCALKASSRWDQALEEIGL
jgi:hypothetical protein